jgi:acyl-CoA dehydrogenase
MRPTIERRMSKTAYDCHSFEYLIQHVKRSAKTARLVEEVDVALGMAETASLAQGVGRFVRERLIPREAEIDDNAGMPADVVAEIRGLGLFALTMPEEYGGLGLMAQEETEVVFELCYGAADFRNVVGANISLGGSALVQAGSNAQKERYLPRIASGEIIAAFGLTESQSGSDASAVRTRATRLADRRWQLSGAKRYITNAGIADLYTIVARSKPDSTGSDGLSLFLVERGTPGMSFGKPERKLGQRGTVIGDVIFDDCVLPVDALLGAEGDAFKVIIRQLNRSRVHIAACCVGHSRRLIDEALAYAMERRQFGQPIAQFQLVQAMLADSQADYLAAQAMVRDTARRIDIGESTSIDSSCCKMFASEALGRIADRALQILGGAGYVSGPVERLYRDQRMYRIIEGTTQIQQTTIARQMIKAFAGA